jgi:hypothetical protein
MKKFLILFVFMALFSFSKVNAIELSSYKSGYFISYTNDNKNYLKEISYFFINGSNDYFNCLNIDNIFDYKIEQDDKYNLEDKEKLKIKKILYYGLNYRNHTDNIWFIVDQFRIWQLMYPNLNLKLVNFNGEPITKLDGYFKELDNDIFKSDIKPSFGLEISANLKTQKSFMDYNNVIQDYKFVNSALTSTIENNIFSVYSIKPGVFNVELKRSYGKENFAVYTNKNSTFVNGSNGFTDYLNIKVNILGTSFSISSDGESNWGLYNEDKLLKEIKVLNFYNEDVDSNLNLYLKNLDDNNTIYKIVNNKDNIFKYNKESFIDVNKINNDKSVIKENSIMENPKTTMQRHYLLLIPVSLFLIINIVLIIKLLKNREK